MKRLVFAAALAASSAANAGGSKLECEVLRSYKRDLEAAHDAIDAASSDLFREGAKATRDMKFGADLREAIKTLGQAIEGREVYFKTLMEDRCSS
ncbi:hypothetical protein [Antarctobacter sp.]|uniref:hypothetical protein n=1 Tax=Antarctobacter sp. TaxID=1872577 RepID=UPI003A8E6BE4